MPITEADCKALPSYHAWMEPRIGLVQACNDVDWCFYCEDFAGDANRDRKVSAADLTALQLFLGGLPGPLGPGADANRDGSYDEADLVEITHLIFDRLRCVNN